jgi:hypothetical protein
MKNKKGKGDRGVVTIRGLSSGEYQLWRGEGIYQHIMGT